MKVFFTLTGIFLSALMLVMISCQSDTPVQTLPNITASSFQVSECGGFITAKKAAGSVVPFSLDPHTYCDAERFLWNYDEKDRTVSILNTRVLLNCCGDHSVSTSFENGTIIITENDQPENGTGRCRCMCVFDYFVAISGISPGNYPTRLELTIDDSTETKWEGILVVIDGSGEIIIDDEPLTHSCP